MREHSIAATSDLAKRSDFSIGLSTIRPSRRTIEAPGGKVSVEPRVMQVLVALYDAQGEVLSRDDLLAKCWNGVIVGDDAINRTISEIRRIVRAIDPGFTVETIPRVGYRLIGKDSELEPTGTGARRSTPQVDRRRIIFGALIATAAAAAGSIAILRGNRTGQVDRLIEQGRLEQVPGNPGSLARAEKMFRAAIEQDANNAEAWGWLARVTNDPSNARAAAEKALYLDRGEANARVVLITQRRDLDDWSEWENALLEVLKDQPNNSLALEFLTVFYQGVGRCKASWRTNERVLMTEPFNSTAQHRKAMKHWIFGRIPEADRVADQAMRLWPLDPFVWNARLLIYAFTDRPAAALSLIDDVASRPASLTEASERFWRTALKAIETKAVADVSAALDISRQSAGLAPGLAANAIMVLSYLGELDGAFEVASGLFEARGTTVQKWRGQGIRDLYSGSDWGRTQFLFIPATARFRADPRFRRLTSRTGHLDYWQKSGVWPDPFVRGSITPA